LKVRIKFRKYGIMKFIGHLDVMRFFQKAMRRADIPIAFTGGYSPHMIMSFAQPLGVGITSDGEYLDIEITKKISSREALRRLNQVSVEGIEIVGFVEIPDDRKSSGMTIVAAADYRVYLPVSEKSSERPPLPDEWREAIGGFMAQEQIVVWKKTKKSEKEVDIKPMIYDMRAEDTFIRLFLAAGSEHNLKPELVMEAFLAYAGTPDISLRYHRADVYARDGQGGFVPLGGLGRDIL